MSVRGMSKSKLSKETDVLTFGKFKGLTVKDILEEQPDYLIWLIDENICEVSDELIDLADEMNYSGYEDNSDIFLDFLGDN